MTLGILCQANPAATMNHITVLGPLLADCLKDGSTPVRLAAERCLLHVFRLTKGYFTFFFSFPFLYLLCGTSQLLTFEF